MFMQDAEERFTLVGMVEGTLIFVARGARAHYLRQKSNQI
jgi:hypothetical protein